MLLESLFSNNNKMTLKLENPKGQTDDYLTFNNMLAIKSWSKNIFKTWVKSLNKDEFEALNKYSGFKSLYINRYLRGKKGIDFSKNEQELVQGIKNIETAISKFSAPSNIVVYRGASFKSLFGHDIKFPEKLLGKGLHNKAFMSVSLLEDVAKRFAKDVILKIKIPKGTNLAFMGAISFFEKEGEILLNKDSKLVITKITKQKNNNCFLLECELL